MFLGHRAFRYLEPQCATRRAPEERVHTQPLTSEYRDILLLQSEKLLFSALLGETDGCWQAVCELFSTLSSHSLLLA